MEMYSDPVARKPRSSNSKTRILEIAYKKLASVTQLFLPKQGHQEASKRGDAKGDSNEVNQLVVSDLLVYLICECCRRAGKIAFVTMNRRRRT